MNNHVHMIAAADYDHNLSDILRDMKKFTSKQLIAAIRDNPQESRKRWMMWIFTANGIRNGNNKTYQFWQQDNRPIELSTPQIVEQRLDYLHNNPVVEGLVAEPRHYVYGSAVDYEGGKGPLDVEFCM